MPSTDKTPNIELSQFNSTTDKPSWRGDYNGDMLKIDQAMGQIETDITQVSNATVLAQATANNATATAEAASQDAQTAVAGVALAATAVDLDAAVARITTAETGLNNRFTKVESDGRYVQIQDVETPIAVFVGTSNVIPNTWPEKLGAEEGWDVHNFAISGMGITFGGSNAFRGQLERAAASNAFANADVDYVFIADGANDARSTVPVLTAARSLLAYARVTFPNARIIVLPALFSASSVDLGNNVRISLSRVMSDLKLAAAENGAEYIDGSWTWHLDDPSLVVANEVHYTPAGYDRVVDWVQMFLRGGDTWNNLPWTDMPIASPYTVPSGGDVTRIRVKREMGEVTFTGAFKPGSGGIMNSDSPVVFPRGTSPRDDVPVIFSKGGQLAPSYCVVKRNGYLNLFADSGAIYDLLFNTSYSYL